MAHPWHHALLSVKRWGGLPEDYLAVHEWFDQSKSYLPDFRHRALRHHAEGIYLAEMLFGVTIANSDGDVIPVRWIGEQHVKEDLARIPTASDWLRCIRPEPWMSRSEKLAEAEKGEPLTQTITWPKQVDICFRGRNGFGFCCGLEVFLLNGTIELTPITSQGNLASCNIHLPLKHLDHFIAALESIRKRRRPKPRR